MFYERNLKPKPFFSGYNNAIGRRFRSSADKRWISIFRCLQIACLRNNLHSPRKPVYSKHKNTQTKCSILDNDFIFSTVVLFVFLNVFALQIYYKPATCIIDGVMDTILSAFIASASKIKSFITYEHEHIHSEKGKDPLRASLSRRTYGESRGIPRHVPANVHFNKGNPCVNNKKLVC